MQRLSARPHHVGSPYDKDNAEWMLAKFKEWGLDANIESFDVLFPTPKVRVVELLEPTKFTAKLQEPALAIDPTSNQQAEQLPTYNAYSADGDVTAPLVYVNYGTPDDYEKLERMGVSVKGAIVIARYGNSWRGIKPKVAAEHGAVGCLIYSDPADDGYVQGDVFPVGAWRPRDGVQRGSVMDMPIYPGDPLTPGVGATKDAKRLDLKDAKTITKIPVLPISYADAQPLLAALKGEVVPEAWRGSLPQTYHLGPGPAKVHLKVQSNWDIKPLYDVIVKIPGSTNPDEWIVRGNHHDAWVNGAEDPVSGTVVLMEEARAFADSAQAGLEAQAHHHLLRVGRRRAGTARLHRVGRSSRRRTSPARRGLHQQRRQRSRLSRHGRIAFAGKIHQRRGPRHSRSRKEDHGLEARPTKSHRRRQDARRPERSARTRRPAHRRSGLRIRLDGLSRSSGHRLAGPELRRRRWRRNLPLHLR